MHKIQFSRGYLLQISRSDLQAVQAKDGYKYLHPDFRAIIEQTLSAIDPQKIRHVTNGPKTRSTKEDTLMNQLRKNIDSGNFATITKAV